MNVEETILLKPEELECPTPELVASLPTIIDVLEYLSQRENAEFIKNGDGIFGSKMGNFIATADKPFSREIKLIPQSYSMFTLMRGEAKYHKECKASYFRMEMTEDKQLVERIKTAEFLRVIGKHPMIQIGTFGNLKMEPLAIAQHYGFKTEYMDLTNNKWVAAFFATCKWNKGDVYTPVEEGYGEGIGILYVSQPSICDVFSEDIVSLGYQYYARPSKQFTWMYRMAKDSNFDQNPMFMRIVFRHDAEASRLVFEQSGRQHRYYPIDYVSDVARTIQEDDYVVSWASVEYARKLNLISATDEKVKEVFANLGVKYHENDEPMVQLDRDAVEKNIAAWFAEDGKELMSRIIIPPLVYPL